MSFQIPERDMNLLCDAFLVMESKNEVKKLLSDLLSPKELESMVDRIKIAKRVAQNIPYRTIASNLNCSTTTVTRVASKLNHGQGGLLKAFSKLNP
jgi:TrpR-related protein YerC/YecD